MTVYEVTIIYDSPTGEQLNVCHWDFSSEEVADFQLFADIFRTDWLTTLAPVIAPSISLESLSIREDVPGSVAFPVAFTAGPATGASSDNQYAAIPAVNVQKLPNNLTKPRLGRVYQGGITSEGFLSNGNWSATITTACNDFWSDQILVTMDVGKTATMVIKASDPTKPNTVPYNPVATIASKGKPTKQGRRSG